MRKSAIQYLQGLVFVGTGNFLGMAAGLITIVCAVRLTSKEEMGGYFLVLVVAQFGSILGDIGLKNTAIKVLSSSLPAETIQAARFFITISFLSSLGIAAATLMLLPALKVLWPFPAFVEHAWLSAPLSFFMSNFQMASSLLVAEKKFKSLSLLSVAMEILRAILSVTALFCGLGVSGLLWGMIVSRVLALGAVWWCLPAHFGFSLRHPSGLDFIKFGGWLYGCSLLSVVLVKASDFILATYMGPAALAVYSAAMQLPSALQRVFESIRPVLLGYVSSGQQHDPARLAESIRIGAGVLALAATILIGLTQPLMTLLFSQNYEGGTLIMQGLCVWTATSIVNYYFSITLIGIGHPRKAFLLVLPQVLLGILTTWFLVQSLKGFGAAVALIVTSLIGNVIGSRLVAGNSRSQFYLFNTAHLRATIPLLLLLGAIYLQEYSIMQLTVMIGATISLLWLTKALTVQDGQQLLRMLTGSKSSSSASMNAG